MVHGCLPENGHTMVRDVYTWVDYPLYTMAIHIIRESDVEGKIHLYLLVLVMDMLSVLSEVHLCQSGLQTVPGFAE